MADDDVTQSEQRYHPSGMPIANRPGAVGMHALVIRGRSYTAVPWGGVRRQHLMPLVHERRYWHELRRAGGREPGPDVEPILRCARCKVGIGRRYVHTSVYLVPELGRDPAGPVEWRPCCATCAVLELELPYALCFVAENDWADADFAGVPLQLPDETVNPLVYTLLSAKILALEEQIAPLWTRALALAREADLLPETTNDDLREVYFEILRQAPLVPCSFTELAYEVGHTSVAPGGFLDAASLAAPRPSVTIITAGLDPAGE